MDEKNNENLFPTAMRDMGNPDEMSPIQDLTNSESTFPVVEVTKPVSFGEPNEIRETDPLSKFHENTIE
ncbi:hypothetical protein ACQCN2_06800 [Brevibacillus ginsengisoli]|uniref:hypothetical protein n=1 Tax=Brevibacillus ginsengisoli TaxID=363854 RepID=UPI003CEB9450